jgi:hypothetical protein
MPHYSSKDMSQQIDVNFHHITEVYYLDLSVVTSLFIDSIAMISV